MSEWNDEKERQLVSMLFDLADKHPELEFIQDIKRTSELTNIRWSDIIAFTLDSITYWEVIIASLNRADALDALMEADDIIKSSSEEDDP